MSRRTTRKRQAKSTRPSTFFIVTMIVGIALLIWVFSQVAMRPMRPPAPPPPAHSTR